MNDNRLGEVLAPAGSWDAMVAGVRCGADAVYFGSGIFNARRNAANFDGEALPQAVAYCHARGVRVHLTLNTLVRQEELPEALALAQRACEAGVDALIVQDVGLAWQLRLCAPAMPLHASTQLSCHTPAGVRELAEAGFSRVVLAREMTAAEIAACAEQGCELEVFVHGALCMSVSGQCYLSAMLGGRSGNRGLCAQPCRLPFTARDGRPGDDAALSLRDLSLLSYMPVLARQGVCSFKIEGRMKRPEYVAAAVTACRAALCGAEPDRQLLEDLQSVFSRSGFTDGYYTAQRDATMFGVRRREDVTAASPVLGRLAHLYDQETGRVPVRMTLSLRRGKPARLAVADEDGHAVCAVGAAPQEALTRPLDEARAAAQCGKCGGTPFVMAGFCYEADQELTLPVSALNTLRRDALQQLLTMRERPRAVAFSFSGERLSAASLPSEPSPFKIPTAAEAAVFSPVQSSRSCIVARFFSADQWTPGADVSLLPLSASREDLLRCGAVGTIGVEIPRAMFGSEDAVRTRLRQAAQAGVRYALCGNIGAVPLAREAGLLPVGGFGLNITNAQALAFYTERGLAATLLSMELRFAQMAFAQTSPIPVGLFAAGRQPLMLLRNCPVRASIGCQKRAKTKSNGCHLTDRKDVKFPLQCENGCGELLNSTPLYWADQLQELPTWAFRYLHFTTETTGEASELLAAMRNGGPARNSITRGLYRRGVE